MNTTVKAEVRENRLKQETFPHINYGWSLDFDDIYKEKTRTLLKQMMCKIMYFSSALSQSRQVVVVGSELS